MERQKHWPTAAGVRCRMVGAVDFCDRKVIWPASVPAIPEVPGEPNLVWNDVSAKIWFFFRFNGHFQGGPGLTGTRLSPF